MSFKFYQLVRTVHCLCLLISAHAWLAYPSIAAENFISLQAVNEPLEKVLDRISKISGYTIELQSEQNDIFVDAILSNVPLEKVFSIILGNSFNHAVIWNDEKKTIILSIVGRSSNTKGDRTILEHRYNPVNTQMDIINKLSDHLKGLSGQDTRFEQMSKTTNN